MSFSLKLLGGVALQGDAGPVTGPAVQRHRLALLAVLAVAHPAAVSRDKLMALLWPERETESARRLLNQAVHAVRRALGGAAILSVGEELQLDAESIRCDVAAFVEAVRSGRADHAVAAYTGPFLDGFFLAEAPEFERWVDRERDRLAAAYARALEDLAEAAERAGNWNAAVERWRARTTHDPYDSRVVLRLMQALERSGNRAGALQHAALHQQMLREELEIEPSPEVQALTERLRREPIRPPARSRGWAGEPSVAAPSAEPAAGSSVDPAPAAPPPRRRGLWIGAGALLLAAVLGGALHLGARNGGEDGPSPKVVDELAQAVARELARRERGDTARPLPQHRTHSIPAYELYLRANDPVLLRSDSGARRALEYFRRAVALDSTYAAAWAGLGRLTIRAVYDSPDSERVAWAEGEVAFRKALALDDSLAEPHAMLGVMLMRKGNSSDAIEQFERAIVLEPTHGRIREWYSSLFLQMGRTKEALIEAERAMAIDPRSPSAVAEYARALLADDRCEEALARLETLAKLDPPLLRAPPIAARCYIRMGRWEDAIAILRPLPGGEVDGTRALRGYALARAGRRPEAIAIQDSLLARWRTGGIGAYYLSFIPTGLGEREEAVDWLERADGDGSLSFKPGLQVGFLDPPYRDLQDHPRVRRLRERLSGQKR